MPTDIQAILNPLQISSDQKAEIWDAYQDSTDEDSFKSKFDKITTIPVSVKANLWDAKFGGGIPSPTVAAEAAAKTVIPTLPGKVRRVASGLGESVVGAIGGLAALPSLAKELITKPDVVTALGKFGAGIVSQPAAIGEEIRKDPYRGTGRLVGDVAQLAAGFGVGRAGKALGAADVAPAAGVIPEAAPFAMEAGGGALQSMSSMIARTPLGIKPTVRAITARNAAVTAEAERLLGGGATTSELAGGKVVGALYKARQASEAAENALWNPLKLQTRKQNITVPLTNTIKAIDPDYSVALQAHDSVISGLSPSTQRVFATLNKQKQLTQGGSGVANALPPGISLDEYLAKIPPSQRAEFQQAIQGEAPSWEAIHQARSEIWDLLAAANVKKPLGGYDVTALNKVYSGLTQDLKSSLSEHPDLAAAFKQASDFTKAQKELYGTKGTLTQKYMAYSPTVMPSQMVNKLLSGTPESAANFVKSLGANPEAHQELARGVISNILNKASGNKFGAQEALTDGPAFEKTYLQYRPTLSKLVSPDLLDSWDAFAKEVGKYELTRGGGGTKGGIIGRIATLAEASSAVGAGGALIKGHPGVAMTLAAPLIGGRKLINMMLQPEGPGLFARYLKTGKWTPTLGYIAEGGAYTGVLLPPPSVQKKK